MLAPTVVLLAVPLYRRLPLIRASLPLIGGSLLVGAPVGCLSAIVAAYLCGADERTIVSLAPKSVTAGIAIGVSKAIGGVPPLTAALVIMTGVVGAAFGPGVLQILRVDDMRAKGLAIGVASHGIGTARAFQMSEAAGTFSGLAMTLNGIATAVLLPSAVQASRLASSPYGLVRMPKTQAAIIATIAVSAGLLAVVAAHVLITRRTAGRRSRPVPEPT